MRRGLKACLAAAALAAVPYALAQTLTPPPVTAGAVVTTLPAGSNAPAAVATQPVNPASQTQTIGGSQVAGQGGLIGYPSNSSWGHNYTHMQHHCVLELKASSCDYPECYAPFFFAKLTCKKPEWGDMIEPGKISFYISGNAVLKQKDHELCGTAEWIFSEELCTEDKVVFIATFKYSADDHLAHGQYTLYAKTEITDSCDEATADITFTINVLCLVFKPCAKPTWWEDKWGDWENKHGKHSCTHDDWQYAMSHKGGAQLAAKPNTGRKLAL